MFVILTWHDNSDVNLVSNQDGKTRLFDSHTEAESFAESELCANWEIVEL